MKQRLFAIRVLLSAALAFVIISLLHVIIRNQYPRWDILSRVANLPPRISRPRPASLHNDTLQEPLLSNSSDFIAPLHTHGRHILDSAGTIVRLTSINWYGASDVLFTPSGLDVRHRDEIAALIRKMGFNSIRLPYSDELVRSNPIVAPELLSANPDLIGMPALDILTAVVQALTDAGLAVIMNNHITQATWCCGTHLDDMCDGRWYNDFLGSTCRIRQSEEDWIQNWETIMRPHVRNPLVIGADLRNEVRAIWGTLSWSQWADAAEKASERLLALNPDWLMVVEGISSANDLSKVAERPIILSVPNRVVYSSHVYSWSGWGALWPYSKRPYESFAKDMRKNWAYLLEEDIAPVWVGEMGAPAHPGKGDYNYWSHLVKFLDEVKADWGYWAINPRKPHADSYEGYGLVNDDWLTVRWDYRLSDLVRLGLDYR